MDNEERSSEIITEDDAVTNPNNFPYPESKGKLNIVLRLFLTLITCFIYGIFWKGKQMSILNGWLERNTYSFWTYIGLSLLTCGIYSIYAEYQLARGISEVRIKYEMEFNPKFATIYSVSHKYFISIRIQARSKKPK